MLPAEKYAWQMHKDTYNAHLYQLKHPGAQWARLVAEEASSPLLAFFWVEGHGLFSIPKKKKKKTHQTSPVAVKMAVCLLALDSPRPPTGHRGRRYVPCLPARIVQEDILRWPARPGRLLVALLHTLDGVAQEEIQPTILNHGKLRESKGSPLPAKI